MEKEPYFPYGKRNQIGKVSKLLLIIILAHATAIWIFIRTPGVRLKGKINNKGWEGSGSGVT